MHGQPHIRFQVHSFQPSVQSTHKRYVIITFIDHTSSSSKESAPSSTVLLCPLWPFSRMLYTTTNHGSTVGTVIRLHVGQIPNYGIIRNRGNRKFSSSPNLHRYCTWHIFLLNPLALELDIYSLVHRLCKMWIFYEPRGVTLGYTRHFV